MRMVGSGEAKDNLARGSYTWFDPQLRVSPRFVRTTSA